MSDLVIRVSVLGGTSIENAIKDAIELRKETGTNIEFSFNGVKVFICRDDQTVKDLALKYGTALHSGDLVA
jgi:hypothetical protein